MRFENNLVRGVASCLPVIRQLLLCLIHDCCGIYTSSSFPYNVPVAREHSLVSEGVDRLVRVLTNLLVGALEPDTHDPGRSRASGGEGGAGGQGDGVARGVFVHP